MTTQEAVNHFGSVKELARFLDLWPQAIYLWGDYPPMGKQYELQVRTQNELKAEETERTN